MPRSFGELRLALLAVWSCAGPHPNPWKHSCKQVDLDWRVPGAQRSCAELRWLRRATIAI
eukprot:15444033-Alexandrium_andersonii.AAC.1